MPGISRTLSQAEQPDGPGVQFAEPDDALDGGGCFPAPFGPRMPEISPSATENDTSSTATADP